MNKKTKILVITHWYYPRNNPRSFRARALVDELNRRGYDCDVLIGEKEKIIKKFDIDDYYISGNDSTRNGESSLNRGKFIRKIVHFLIGEKFIISKVNRIYNMLIESDFVYSTVISIGNPFYVHLLSAKIKKHYATVAIADCGDPFYLGPHKHSIIVKLIQKYTFSSIDCITIPIEEAKKYYVNFVDENKIHIIPQGFSKNGIQIKKFHEDKSRRVRFAYAGAFYDDIRNPENLLNYLSKVNIDFEFDIYTLKNGKVYKNILLKYKEILKDKLLINPYMQREKCIEELSQYDFLVNLQNTVGIQAPSKLIDYALANRPVISVKPDFIDKEAISRFLKRDYSTKTIIDIDKYKIENVTDQFINIIKNGV